MTDPDKGAWSCAYNPLGQLVSQTDAKGQLTRMHYDALGRMLTRTDSAGGGGDGDHLHAHGQRKTPRAR
jgi:YD repeat-containing protein